MLSNPAPAAVGLRRILVTGFDPFGGQSINPSWIAVQALDGLDLGGLRVVPARLPTQFGHALSSLEEMMARRRPSLVVCTG